MSWYLLSLAGEIKLWIIIIPILVFLYFLLRQTRWSRVSSLQNDARRLTPARREEKTNKRILFKRFLFLFIISLIVSVSLIYLLKQTVNLPRICIPCPADNCNPYCPTNNAFPSGHSGIIFCLFASIYLIFRRKRKKGHAFPLLTELSSPLNLLFIIPVLVAYSRIMLGVHTYLDIFVGSLIGIIVPVFVGFWLRNKRRFKE